MLTYASEEVESAPRMKSKTPHRNELDLLRFFAFCGVFVHHHRDVVPIDPSRQPWQSRIAAIGAFGVPVFFLLSAYLITDLLLRERKNTGKIHVRAFYVRRILRIWPLYFAAFFGLALINHILPGMNHSHGAAWLAFTLFVGNWWVHFQGWITKSIDPLWSISVEEQFYIVIPLLAAWSGRKGLQYASWLCLALAYVVVLTYGLRLTVGDNGEWTNSFVQFQFFAVGTLTALLLRGTVPTVSMPQRAMGFVAGFAFWMTALMVFGVQSWEPHTTALGGVLGWTCILAGSLLFFLCALGTPARFIPRWLAYLGKISYGLYVFHSYIYSVVFHKLGPVLNRRWSPLTCDIFETLLVLGLTIGTAALSFRYFEQPFLALKKRFTFV